MGRFSGKSSATAKANRDLIRINPYEIPEIALAVISNICQKKNTDDASVIIGSLKEELAKSINGENFYEFIEKNRKDLYDFDFLTKIRKILDEIVTELLAHENTNDTQVVVAGGFSAGKSSFLNNLTGSGELLPTGLEPVSMVSTYLYCSAKIEELVVKGINLKDAVVLLDKEILQSIQHESKSKVYLASVLNKLFVELPSKDLDGFVFIDTPGYNNSDKKNDTNNRSDRETALEAIGDGNVLLWIIDSGAGTIPAKDLEVIEYFLENREDRKVAVIFNKADKKGEIEIKKIVDDAASSLRKYGDAIIDVLGYSSQEGKIYYSHKNYDMAKLLIELRKSGTGNSGVERLTQDLLNLFDDEIDFSEEVIKGYGIERKELIDRKNEAYKLLQNEKDGSKNYIKSLKEILVDNYNHIMDRLDNMINLSSNWLDEWGDDLAIIGNTNNNNWQTKENISELVDQGLKKHKKSIDRFNNAIKYSYWNEEARTDWVEKFKDQLDRVDENIKEEYESLENSISKNDSEISKFRYISKMMNQYKDTFKYTLDTCIKGFKMTAHKVQDARIDFGQTTDVFSAIRSGEFSRFLNCFAHGVKINETNSEGYTPLTYAIKNGDNNMVKFLIEHNVDLHSNDGRGYNSLMTAIQFGNLQVIDLLIKTDSTLRSTVSKNGEKPEEIAEKTPYVNMIKGKL